MLDLSAVVARVKSLCPSFRVVGGAAELAAAVDGQMAAPAVYVVPGGHTAERNTMAGAVSQRLTETIDVFVVAKNVTGAGKGAGAVADVRGLVLELRAALHGWSPDPVIDLFELAGGRRESFTPGAMVWREAFLTTYEVRAYP